MTSDRSLTSSARPPLAGSPRADTFWQRLRLRWLVFAITLAGVAGFSLLALVERRAAPVALACALLIAIKGLAWLLVLRHHRARLRRARLRW